MSDFLEEAAEVTEMMLQESLRKRHAVPLKTGSCLFCDEVTQGAFCSTECRQDWETEDKLKKIRGN